MSGSTPPSTSQAGLHRRLDEVVRRHLASDWRQPVRGHSQQAFDGIRSRVEAADRLILDSGCGTGVSTLNLARRFPDALVVGVDKSRARLARAPSLPANALLVRAELSDFWRLTQAAGWPVSRHYLFYPNPWPKPDHLQRRWHGHPVFPWLLRLGGRFELRTNFELYILEFKRALEISGVERVEVVSLCVTEPLSPFERKYAQSGHKLYQLTCDLEDKT
jgi:tRNA (guanine-N7-)-methyltransferase